MHHVILGYFWNLFCLIMSDCRNRYIDEIWCDDKWDREEAHARRLAHSSMKHIKQQAKGTHTHALR